MNRSIQVEGAFGVIKQDYDYNRMLRRGSDGVYKELLFLSLGFNLRKLYNRNIHGRLNKRLFAVETA